MAWQAHLIYYFVEFICFSFQYQQIFYFKYHILQFVLFQILNIGSNLRYLCLIEFKDKDLIVEHVLQSGREPLKTLDMIFAVYREVTSLGRNGLWLIHRSGNTNAENWKKFKISVSELTTTCLKELCFIGNSYWRVVRSDISWSEWLMTNKL